MPDEELSDQDKIFKAQAVKQKMDLEQGLSAFGTLLDEMFRIAPPMKLTPADKEELNKLSTSIRNATATNNTRARIVELLAKGLK